MFCSLTRAARQQVYRRAFSELTFNKQNVDSYVHRLHRCTTLAEVKGLHSELINFGWDKNKFIGNHLVHIYGLLGSVHDALSSFQRTRLRNIFSWTILVAAFAQNGHIHDAKTWFNRMPQQSTVSWNTIVKGLAEAGYLTQARAMFDMMPQPDDISWNSMITAFAQCGHLQEARYMFERMPLTNVISWTAMLTAYAQAAALEEAKRLFDIIPERNIVSWNSLLSGYAQSKDHAALAKHIFTRIPLHDLISWNAVIPAYAGTGDIYDLKCFFDEMPLCNMISWSSAMAAYIEQGMMKEAQSLFSLMPARNMLVWNLMISGYAQAGYMSQARELFNEMLETDVVSWTALITGFVQKGDIGEARRLFDLMPEKDTVAWTMMLEAYAQTGQCKETIYLFRTMDLEGVCIENASFVTALKVCVEMRDLGLGKLIYSLAPVKEDVVICSVAMNLHAKCGFVGDARKIFDRIFKRDVVLWNAMIAAYAQNGHTMEGLRAFREMLVEGEEPDEITFVSVLSACSHKGLLKIGFQYFLGLETDFDRKVGLDHYICMIDLFGRAGQTDKAEELIESMPFEADLLAWKTLLCACATQGDVERGTRATVKIVLDFGVDACELDERSAPFVLLSNLIANYEMEQDR